jgi:hypothetical protein
MLEAALFTKRLLSHFDFFTFVFHFMLDPDLNSDSEPEPEPECNTVSVTIRQKGCGSCGFGPQNTSISRYALRIPGFPEPSNFQFEVTEKVLQ